MFRDFSFLSYLKLDQAVADSNVTVEYLAKHNWLVGTPVIVNEKLAAMHHELVGFGTMARLGTDYADQPEAWRHAMQFRAEEVMPKVRSLCA